MAEKTIFLGGNIQPYAAGARRAGMDSANIRNAGYSVKKAAEILREYLQPGDVVLIKGRVISV